MNYVNTNTRPGRGKEREEGTASDPVETVLLFFFFLHFVAIIIAALKCPVGRLQTPRLYRVPHPPPFP